MIREPAVSGQFYPSSATALKLMLNKLVDKKTVREEVIGAVVPHAGYMYSGAVAGAVFSRIKPKDTYIIIGPNHTGNGKPFSIMTEGVWQTPLGDVQIDSELTQKILANSDYLQEDYRHTAGNTLLKCSSPFYSTFRAIISKLYPSSCLSRRR